MELEEFPKFEFNLDTDTMDSEVLFDFSKESTAATASATLARPKAAAPAQAAHPPAAHTQAPAPTAPPKQQAAHPPAPAATKPQPAYFEEDEPTFELPEFELPDEAGIPAAAAKAQGDSFWELEDALQSKGMQSAKPMPPAQPKAPAAPEAKPAEPAQFVFQETQRLSRDKVFAEATKIAPVGAAPAHPAPAASVAPVAAPAAVTADLGPVLERLGKLEALLQRPPQMAKADPAVMEGLERLEMSLRAAAAAKTDAVILEKLAKLEALVQKTSGSAEVKPESLDAALKRAMPQLLEQVAQMVSAKLPEIIDKAAEKLTAKVAEQFADKLAQSASFDTKDLLTSVAWEVVPDVAEMLVRRELEEIRRNI